MTDLDNLWHAFEDEPFGETAGVPNALALADCLEESGRLALAGAVRWMLQNRKRPYGQLHADPAKSSWWDADRKFPPAGDDRDSDLPAATFARLPAGLTDPDDDRCAGRRLYACFRDAALALADALEKTDHRVKPPREEV